MIALGSSIEIIMPPLIGDCVMVFPLINKLKLNYKITLVCNEYTFYVVSYLHEEIDVKKLNTDSTADIIIDFLSDVDSNEYLRKGKYKCTVGFIDGVFNYDKILEQPKTFLNRAASEIFLYSLNLLNINNTAQVDFTCSKKWISNGQNKILISPSAGNRERCFQLEYFLSLANHLNGRYNISFILGPAEIELEKEIQAHFDVFITKNIKETINCLSDSRIVIASEGGFMHISAAYNIPLIGLFKITSPKNWFPYQNRNQIAIGQGTNNYDNLNIESPFGLETIMLTVDELFSRTTQHEWYQGRMPSS